MHLPAVLRRPLRFAVVGAVAAAVATACAPATTSAVPGNPTDYSVNVWSGFVQRWNPCVPLHYRINAALSPAGLATAIWAVGQLSQATGITFVYDGTTTFVPHSGAWSQPAPLVIGFARHNGLPGGTDYLTGTNQVGEGGFQSSYITYNGTITSYRIVDGYAVIDSDAFNRASAHVRQAVLLHELGHAVGLNHAHFTSEVMYPSVSDAGPNYYSAGDLAGLAKVGRAAGCAA